MMNEDERRKVIEQLRGQDPKQQGEAVAKLALAGKLTIEDARDLLFAVLLNGMNAPVRHDRRPAFFNVTNRDA
jgi:hypothetical protein